MSLQFLDLTLALSCATLQSFGMALQWTIDAEQKQVTIVAQGEVTRSDFEELYLRLSSADAHAYRKLFDGILGHIRMSPEDLLILGVRVRKLHAEVTMGPLAVVLTDSDSNFLAPLLGMLAVAPRPMRIFSKLGAARRWIASQAVPVSS